MALRDQPGVRGRHGARGPENQREAASEHAGRDGGQTVTIENLLIIKIVPEKNLIVVKGSVPGAKGSYLTIRKQWN